MSRQNVELVLNLSPTPDLDYMQIVRDDEMWAARAEVFPHLFSEDFQTVVKGMPGGETTYDGQDGIRPFWLDWLAPWSAFRWEHTETHDLGDRVLVVYRIFARLQDSTQEVNMIVAWVWTVRNGKIARVEIYPDTAEAFKAAGLEG
jgi:ketosteroid isomerase-like protein